MWHVNNHYKNHFKNHEFLGLSKQTRGHQDKESLVLLLSPSFLANKYVVTSIKNHLFLLLSPLVSANKQVVTRIKNHL